MKEEKKCDCIFCNSVCPECGSTDIEMDFKVQWHCDNDTEDRIDFMLQDTEINLICNDCGGMFNYGGWEAGYESCEKLQPLYAALIDNIRPEPLIDIKIDHKGVIKTRKIMGGD